MGTRTFYRSTSVLEGFHGENRLPKEGNLTVRISKDWSWPVIPVSPDQEVKDNQEDLEESENDVIIPSCSARL